MVWMTMTNFCGTADYSFARRENRRHCIRQKKWKELLYASSFKLFFSFITVLNLLAQATLFPVCTACIGTQTVGFFFSVCIVCVGIQAAGKLCFLLHRHPTRLIPRPPHPAFVACSTKSGEGLDGFIT